MNKTKDLAAKINEAFSNMSKGQKRIATFLMEHYEKAVFMTASELGRNVEVSESTVVRFASMLGYSGYPQLQQAVHVLVRNKLTTVQRIEMSSKLDKDKISENVLKADMNNIRRTIDAIDIDSFNGVVKQILTAKRIYVMGLRSSAPLAQFMGYYLNFMFKNVTVVTSGINDIIEQILHINEEDLLIGISFPRYANRAVAAMEFAQRAGACTVALTDNMQSPLCENATLTLTAKNNMTSFVDSLVAPLSVINSLIVASGIHIKDEIEAEFEKLESIWKDYGVYIDKEN